MKLKNYAMALMVGMGLVGITTTAQAGSDMSVFADIGAQSQYIWRGAAQSVNNDVALQGDVGVEHESGLSANVWFSTGVDTGAGQKTEFDITVDYSGEAGDLGYSMGYIAYKYTDTALDFNEVYGGLSYNIASLTAYYDATNKNLYTELSAGTTVADMFDASLAFGVNSPNVGSSTNHTTLNLSKDFESITGNVTVGKAGSATTEFAAGVNYAF
ncbi:MAG: TorF family putative porin [Ghiorsea sp.]|nr:TorF family putative porin [Ghiorsea sp.]